MGKLEYAALRLREVSDFSGVSILCAALQQSRKGDKRWSEADENRVYDLLLREVSEFKPITEEIRAWYFRVPLNTWRRKYSRGYQGLYTVYLGWLTSAYEQIGRRLRESMDENNA